MNFNRKNEVTVALKKALTGRDITKQFIKQEGVIEFQNICINANNVTHAEKIMSDKLGKEFSKKCKEGYVNGLSPSAQLNAAGL